MVPLDLLDVLQDTWRSLSREYDVTARLPDTEILFEGTDLALPSQAAEIVLANMLTEVMEAVPRFSPWYKKPTPAYGLVQAPGDVSNLARWRLTPGTVQRWQPILRSLTAAIEQNIGLILSATLIANLEGMAQDDDPCVMASCACTPPRIIVVNYSVLVGANIKCDACQNQFQPVKDMPDAEDWLNW